MKIDELKPSQRTGGRWLVKLEDGSILRVGENEVLNFGLYTGKELSQEDIDALAVSTNRAKIKERAMGFVTRRPMSCQEFQRKLAEWGAAQDEIEELTQRMEELDFLNDARFAETLVRHYGQKGYGIQKLRSELFRRGVPREYWDKALEKKQDSSDAIDSFLAQKFKGQMPDQAAMKKASDALMRRGFFWNEVREGLNRYGADFYDEST